MKPLDRRKIAIFNELTELYAWHMECIELGKYFDNVGYASVSTEYELWESENNSWEKICEFLDDVFKV